MICTGYIDESGTHAQSPRVVMGGIVGSCDGWERLEGEWNSILREYELASFHSKDIVKNSTSAVKKLGVERRLELTARLQDIYKRETLFGFVCFLNRIDYSTHYLNGPRPAKWAPDSPWGVCFRAGLSIMLEVLRSEFGPEGARLSVVFESGNRNAGDVIRLQKIFERSGEPELVRMLESVSFLPKQRAAGLQAADMLAYTANYAGLDGVNRTAKWGTFERSLLSARVRLPKGIIAGMRSISRIKYPVFALELTPEWLSGLKQSLISRDQARREFLGRAQKK